MPCPRCAADLLRGPWPLLLGALALVNVACLVVSGRPWGITAAFALWGAKLAALLGVEVGAWRYWQGDIALAAAVLGGLLMGIGARLATGCNIGAFFSGVASGSLHGVLWLVFAAPGNAIGVRLRARFRLAS